MQEGRQVLLRVTVHHRTTYKYHQPVTLGAHRLALRPRESRHISLLSHSLKFSPDASVTWSKDVQGNAIATANFAQDKCDVLQIDAYSEVEVGEGPSLPSIDSGAQSYPFSYSDDDFKDLGPLLGQQYPDTEGLLRSWSHAFVKRHPTDTVDLLNAVNQGVFAEIKYRAREDEGTQSPIQTLSRGQGSCRDMAVLFLEAARSLGFGAKIISGYLCNPGGHAIGSDDAGSTHAWVGVFVPGAGWISFDPTNCSMGGSNLIPVAIGRNIQQVTPVSGSFVGARDAFVMMTVSVSVATTGTNSFLLEPRLARQ